MAKNAANAGASSKTAEKDAKKAAKAAKRVASKERRSQIWQAFQMQRKQDKKLLPLMIGALVGTAAVVTLALMWFLPWWMVLPFGIVLGALLAMIIFSRRVQANVYKQAEGTPGAAAWSLQNNLRGKWRITPAIAGTSHMDAVHRAIGRPGIILVGEGAPHRVKPLLAQEKKKIARVVGDTPIYDVIVGNEEGQMPAAQAESVPDEAAAQHHPGRGDRPGQPAQRPVVAFGAGGTAQGSDAGRGQAAQHAAGHAPALTCAKISRRIRSFGLSTLPNPAGLRHHPDTSSRRLTRAQHDGAAQPVVQAPAVGVDHQWRHDQEDQRGARHRPHPHE